MGVSAGCRVGGWPELTRAARLMSLLTKGCYKEASNDPKKDNSKIVYSVFTSTARIGPEDTVGDLAELFGTTSQQVQLWLCLRQSLNLDRSRHPTDAEVLTSAPAQLPASPMNGGPFTIDPVVQEDYMSPLPDALRRSLMAMHSTRPSKHSATPWRPEMDAFVLLCHVRDGISLPKVAEQWPFESATKRSKE